MLSPDELAGAARSLREAERTRKPIAPLSEAYPGLDLADAYAVQQINVDEAIASGALRKGHKVGLTSRAMQDQFKVGEPDYGHLLSPMFVFEGGEILVGELCAPRVEVEVAFVLGSPLAGPGVTVVDVLRATAFVVPALEIVDSRIADWRIKLVDTIADNASAGRVVLGGRGLSPLELDLRTIGATLGHNGRVVDSGASGAVLGNPATAVAWLANKLAELGVGLEAGHVVMAGSCTRALSVEAGDAVRADFDHLGHVGVNFV